MTARTSVQSVIGFTVVRQRNIEPATAKKVGRWNLPLMAPLTA